MEKTRLDEEIQAAIADVAFSRKKYCSAASKYYAQSLSVDIKAVKNCKCVLPKKNVDSTCDIKTLRERLYPLPSSGDTQKKLGILQKKVDNIVHETDNLQKIMDLNNRLKRASGSELKPTETLISSNSLKNGDPSRKI